MLVIQQLVLRSGVIDSGDNDYKFTASGVGNVGSDAQGVTFSVSGNRN